LIHIAMCGNNLDLFSFLTQEIEKYQRNHKRLDIKLRTITNRKSIRKALSGDSRIGIYFLDCDSLTENGLALAKEIRDSIPDAVMVFLSSTKELAYDAYTCHAQRFLLYPIVQKQLFEALDHTIAYVNGIQKKVFGLQTSSGLAKIAYNQLTHIESKDRQLRAHCKNGRIYRSVALRSSVEKTLTVLLSDQHFVQVHKSFVVNMSHIKSISYKALTMQNGAQIPIAQSRYAEVRSSYREFIGLDASD
jgi:DNA-binding LytR/AlgR family response regulator